MNRFGINGAGSSLTYAEEFELDTVAAAISLEGRKFLKLVPFDISFMEFRRKFILGSNAWETGEPRISMIFLMPLPAECARALCSTFGLVGF